MVKQSVAGYSVSHRLTQAMQHSSCLHLSDTCMHIEFFTEQLSVSHCASIKRMLYTSLTVCGILWASTTVAAANASHDLIACVAARALDRDNFKSAEEAREWGLIDEVIDRRPTFGGDGPSS